MVYVLALTGSATSLNDCHSLAVEEWNFMHNGQGSGLEHFRNKVEMLLPNHYPQRLG
ncbi:hypothetical protein GCM10007939_06920 [Amylibacter marinus]|uniref:Uncharacterized protein n=1 Tax=Amylibacter marinus TaxID=1475483 RepID=A0ABQ5VTB3_9RHOB|nr:hypothetical protein GCM10007939_06920 [Amylibacter marinus]